jgi:hypothetical protein
VAVGGFGEKEEAGKGNLVFTAIILMIQVGGLPRVLTLSVFRAQAHRHQHYGSFWGGGIASKQPVLRHFTDFAILAVLMEYPLAADKKRHCFSVSPHESGHLT